VHHIPVKHATGFCPCKLIVAVSFDNRIAELELVTIEPIGTFKGNLPSIRL
jgi:hypothetical protein